MRHEIPRDKQSFNRHQSELETDPQRNFHSHRQSHACDEREETRFAHALALVFSCPTRRPADPYRPLFPIGFRLEVRDLYTSKPTYNVGTGGAFQYNIAFSGGLVLHF
jgi:hypothetical protein